MNHLLLTTLLATLLVPTLALGDYRPDDLGGWRGSGQDYGKEWRSDGQGGWRGGGKNWGSGWRPDGVGGYRGTGENFGVTPPAKSQLPPGAKPRP